MASSDSWSEFAHQLRTESRRVLIYENPELQHRARECIPTETLAEKARQNDTDDWDFRDKFLLELLFWFKNEFFTWFDAAHCNFCDESMQRAGLGASTAEDLKFGAHNVELYRCLRCGRSDRFPRYNDPGKLLETRTGRCGEWANCFTLMCRSLNYDARYIRDWTDHVWTEVYSEKLKRWLHCDPCEAVCDKPLLYEVGWGKKLTYVIAFSKDEVQEVTWRYTTNFPEVEKRRRFSSELIYYTTAQLSKNLQSRLLPQQRNHLDLRLIAELSETLTPRKVTPEELKGRTSGDINWRKSRGELGSHTFKPVIWIPSETELENGEFSLEYSSSLDQYIRRSDNNSVTAKWFNGIFEADSVFRKVEYDWKVSYLARTEGSPYGKIVWKFDLSATKDLTILQVCISCPGTTYEDGSLRWKVCGPDKCELVPNGCVDHEVDLSGSEWCTLTVELERGKGNVAWQHAQVARQSLEDKETFPFSFRVLFG